MSKELREKYNSTSGKCCQCGMQLLTTGEPMGHFFVMDKEGNFYCANCDSIFEDGDERIYEPVEVKHEILPSLWVGDLKDALALQYGDDFIEEVGELRQFLFDDRFMNDVYVSYCLSELEEYTGASWQDEEHIRLENCIKTFLQDVFPDYETVLIDVMW